MNSPPPRTAAQTEVKELAPIRRKAIGLLIIFLLALSIFAIHSLVERFEQLGNAKLDRKWMGANSTIGRVVHELQKERGLSSGYIASYGERFGPALLVQQKVTDSSELELLSLFSQNGIGETIIKSLDDEWMQLHSLRGRVQKQELSRDYTTDQYTELIKRLFDLQLSAFHSPVESSILRKQIALVAFSQAKEAAGQERALLSAILSDGKLSNSRIEMLNKLWATKQDRLTNFLRLADEDARDRYESIVVLPNNNELERIRLKVKTAVLWQETHGGGAEAGSFFVSLPTPEQWFNQSTEAIDGMKQLEDQLNAALLNSAERVETHAWQELVISGSLVVLAIIFIGTLIRKIQQGHRIAEHQINLAETVFNNSVEAIMVTDAEQRIVAVNSAFLKISGYDHAEVIGQHPRILNSGRHDASFFERMWRELNDQGSWQGEVWNRRKNGEVFPALLSIAVVRTPSGEIENYTSMIFDLSEQKTVESLLTQLRTFDGLTTLPNRESWLSSLDQQLANAKRNAGQFSVLLVDLDRFKSINESLGFSVGDQVLIEAAERIKTTLRKYDVVARLGGNRFSILLSEISDPKAVGNICEKLLTSFATPFELNGLNVHISISIGAALYPNDGDDTKTLMMAAESALFSAKADGRSQYKFYASEMNELGGQLFKLERMLRLALERNEFSVVYQPQVSAITGKLVGVEALLRWFNPELGNVSPVQFIPIAEETGLIIEIGEWIMRSACKQSRQWQVELGVEIPVAVNLSARQFRRADLLASIQLILDETGLPSRLLELEITEGSLIVDPVGATDLMRGLNILGIKTALDDFGTGYSSLSYLKTFPLNRLKIDRAFVRDLPQDESDCAISNTIISLGHNLNMEVLAEGIETEAQRDFLAKAGCHVFQGYLFGKPVSAEVINQRLRIGDLVAGHTAG